jgi:hypothetical protein
MFQTKGVKKIKTHILVQKLFPENRVIYEIMGKNIVERGRPHDLAHEHCMLHT